MKSTNPKKNYYQVIPLVRLPLTKSNEFTYHSLDKISFGSIVKIKLNNKITRGVIVGEFKNKNTSGPTFKTSPILTIITPSQITKKQFSLAKLISEYYLTPLSITLKFFIFRLTKKNNPQYFTNLQKKLRELKEDKWSRKITLTKNQKQTSEKIISSKKHSFLLFGPPASGKTEVVVEVIKDILAQNKQVLVLIPEIFLSYQEILRYGSKFFKETEEKIAILHSQLKPSEITTIWNNVKSGKIKLIISTRMGVFLPFENLGLVVVDEEQDISHKQWDTPPFYHVHKVTHLLEKIYSLKSIFVSSTPSLSNYYKTKKSSQRKILTLAPLQTKSIAVKQPQIELVDLKKCYKKGQQILISKELHFSLKNSLDKKKIAMVLVPRRGKSKTIICQDCQETPTCPDCQVPLVHSENYYKCLHCSFKISNISKCPHCGSFRLADIGFGTESVQDLIQTMFPSATTAIADGTTFADDTYRRKVLGDLYANKIDFLIGTYAIAKGLDITNVNLVAIMNADNWPGQTDFRFDENYLSTIFQLAGRVNRPGGTQDGKCLIQTFDPTNRIFTYLKNWNWQEFIDYELSNRKALGYPPFKHLIKITYRNYNKETVEKELDKLYKQLSNFKPNTNFSTPNKPVLSWQLLPPYYGYQEKLRGQFQKHLLLKISQLPITNKKFLKLLDLPTGWKIDVDTENVF